MIFFLICLARVWLYLAYCTLLLSLHCLHSYPLCLPDIHVYLSPAHCIYFVSHYFAIPEEGETNPAPGLLVSLTIIWSACSLSAIVSVPIMSAILVKMPQTCIASVTYVVRPSVICLTHESMVVC